MQLYPKKNIKSRRLGLLSFRTFISIDLNEVHVRFDIIFFLCTSDERLVYQMSMDELLAMLNILKNVIISFLDELSSMFNRLRLLTRHRLE